MQLQQYKQGVIPPSVPAIEEKPKENGQVEIGDQVANVNNKVIVFFFVLDVLYIPHSMVTFKST